MAQVPFRRTVARHVPLGMALLALVACRGMIGLVHNTVIEFPERGNYTLVVHFNRPGMLSIDFYNGGPSLVEYVAADGYGALLSSGELAIGHTYWETTALEGRVVLSLSATGPTTLRAEIWESDGLDVRSVERSRFTGAPADMPSGDPHP